MISRRNFLKLAGLSTLALGSGYLTGKLTQSSKPVYYSIHGFIPEDEKITKKILTAFKNKVRSNSEALTLSDSKFGEVITRLDKEFYNSNYNSEGKITYTLKRLRKPIDSDLIISDDNNTVMSLDDFSGNLFNLRNELRGRKADYVLTVEYREEDFLSSLFKSNKKEVVIENEKGVAEKISLSKNYKNISVSGIQGKTDIAITNGTVRVLSSACRHEICKQTIASKAGDIIACAPNKVLIKIV